jgi:YD repeat-containing protein
MLGDPVRRARVIRLVAPAMVVLLVATALQLLSVVAAPAPAVASTVTGTGGLFVPATGRLVDSRSGQGLAIDDNWTGPLEAGAWFTVQASGVLGMPATGVGAVQVTVTAVSPTTTGVVNLSPGEATSYTALVYGAGVAGSVSNTAIVALASDGTFGIRTQTSVNVTIDVQGYYTDASSNGTSPGGYVPSEKPTRIVDTRISGTGLPQGKLGNGSTSTVQVTGKAGVPAGASAAFINFEIINYGSADGELTAYAADVARPGTSLSFPGGETTAVSQVVPLSATGAFKIYLSLGGGGTIDLSGVDVVGYFTDSNPISAATSGSAMFTPASTRVADAVVVPGSSAKNFSIAGIGGVPVAGSGIRAAAVNIQVQHGGTAPGSVRIESDSTPSPGFSTLLLAPVSIRSNLVTVGLGNDGGVTLTNGSTDPLYITLDVEGWYTAPAGMVKGGQSTTTRSVVLQAAADGLTADQDSVTYKYRIGSLATFQNIPDGSSGQLKDGNGAAATQPTVLSSGRFPPLTWDVADTVTAAGGSSSDPTLVQVEACYGTSSGAQYCPTPWSIVLTPSLASESTAPLGPGVLSLATGDYTISATDAAITSSLGGLSIGRSLDTLAPAPANDTASGVFGPGWRADLVGPDAGEADLQPVDRHTTGYLVFTNDTGTPTVFQAVSPTSTFPIHFAPIGDDASDGISLTMTSATSIIWVDPDQTKTVWTDTDGRWVPTVQQTGANPASTTTKYFYNSAGLVTRILGPSPAGVTCTDANADTTPGCRSLVLRYGGSDCNTNSPNRLCAVSASLPTSSGTKNQIEIQRYAYTTDGQELIASYDPRISPALITFYGYDADHRLTSITPPGQNPWKFGYDASGRLSTVSRTVPVTDPGNGSVSNQAAVDTVVYGLPLSGTLMPDVRASTAASWNETTDLPVTGTAVFPPDHQPNSTDPDHVGSGDWPFATIHYLDTNGREVNTAAYGAGQWLIDTTQYDNNGNDVWDLDAGSRAQALDPVAGTTDPFVAGKESSSTRADLLASTTVYNPLDPSEVTDTYGPTHPVTLLTGAVIHARTHSSTTYDQNAPGATNPATGAPYRLPTKVVTDPFNVDTGADAAYPDRSTTVAGYAAVGSMSGYTGWSLGMPTTSTVQMGASPSSSDLTTTTVYDADGRVIQTRLPGDSGGTTPRATNTTYYTATGTGTCANAAFAGLICQTSPAAQPSSGAALPTVTDTYDQWGDVLTQTSKYVNATTTTKKTTNFYDTAGRLLVSGTVVTPEPADDTGLPAITTTYDPATGQVATTKTGSSGGPQILSTTYNSVGAVSTYTDTTGNVTTTGYDIDGRPIRQSDSKGTVTLQYDGSDEHRGLVTSEDIGAGSESTFTAAYDASGDLATQTYPGGLTATRSYDNAGDPTGLTYTKAGTVLLDFTQAYGDANTGDDHIVAQASQVNGAAYSSQKFTDDDAGRLTTVADTYDGSCTTRFYGYDASSDRVLFASYPAAADGSCSMSTNSTAFELSYYDGADRLTSEMNLPTYSTVTYSYDVLGRTSTVPAGDAVGIGSHHAAAGDLALGYYDNDMVASQAQGSGDDATTIAFGLDPDQNRILTETTTTPAGTKTLTNRDCCTGR